jgi:hypothetical protein
MYLAFDGKSQECLVAIRSSRCPAVTNVQRKLSAKPLTRLLTALRMEELSALPVAA